MTFAQIMNGGTQCAGLPYLAFVVVIGVLCFRGPSVDGGIGQGKRSARVGSCSCLGRYSRLCLRAQWD